MEPTLLRPSCHGMDESWTKGGTIHNPNQLIGHHNGATKWHKAIPVARSSGGLGKRGHVVSAMMVSATVVGEIAEVVGDIAEVVGKITVVVGRLAEVVGVVADVVGEIAEVVGRVVASSGQLRPATACCGQLWLATSGYG